MRAAPLALVLFGLLARAAEPTPDAGPGIRAADLKRHVARLSTDEMAGRETGAPGVGAAERYIAATLRGYGLSPLPGHDDLMVPFALYRRDYEAEATSLRIGAGDDRDRFRLGTEFRPFDFSAEGSVEAEVVFVGYGITAPELDYDDYDGLDVEGKIVLVLRHQPRENDPDSSFAADAARQHALFATKAINAEAHGAVGMVLVTDPLNHPGGDDLRTGRRLTLNPPERADDARDRTGIVAVHLSREPLDAIVAPSGLTLADMQRAVDEGTSPRELDLNGLTARLGVKRQVEAEEVPARNVLAFLEGRDPLLKNEWIVIGGHHDHIGGYSGEGDTVFNGADDNASGVSGVLELARAFASRPERPRRSLVFATFTGEEKGLLGSKALADQELIALDRVVHMLNLDMIGRNPERNIQVHGDGHGRDLREIVEEANLKHGLPLDFQGSAYAGNSDHDSFYKQDIPFLFFFTGTHDDYHQLGDHADKLDYARMQGIVGLAYDVVERLAESDRVPHIIHHIFWLGLRVEVLDRDEGPRAVVTAVEAGSRAAGSGFRAGDVIAAFDGRELDDPGTVGRRFREVEPGSDVSVAVNRGEGDRTLAFERARTGYLGVAPEALDGDRRRTLGLSHEEGVLLRSVVPDGPADVAGLEDGDILIRISGQPVTASTLRTRLGQIGAGETVDLTVIRDGERTSFPVTLGQRP